MKDCIDADFHLVFNKTFRLKNGSMGWDPGPAKGGQNFQNIPSLCPHFQKPPPKTKNVFFRFQLEDLLNPWMVWIVL